MLTARVHRGAPGTVAGAAERPKPKPQVNRATEGSPPRHVRHSRRALDRARKREPLRAEARQRMNRIAPVHAAGAGRDVPAISLTQIEDSALGAGRSGGAPGRSSVSTYVSGEDPVFSAINRVATHSKPYSDSCSKSIRAPRSRTSRKNLFLRDLAQSS